MPSHVSDTSHTSQMSHMSHTSRNNTTKQIQALSLLKDESTISILAYTKHARSLAHGVKDGAGHELLSHEQLDAIDILSSCREDEVRTLLERPHAPRKSSIHLTVLHSQFNRPEQMPQRLARVDVGLALPPFLHQLLPCNALYQVLARRSR